METSDDPDDRDLRRRQLAKRLVSHHARTQTIYSFTGYTRHRLATLRKDHAFAANRFDRSAELWKEVGNLRDMAAMLRSAGQAWSAHGKPAEAAERYYRAARSFYGQNERAAALACLESGFQAADAAKDEGLRRQLAALFEQIKKSVEPAHE